MTEEFKAKMCAEFHAFLDFWEKKAVETDRTLSLNAARNQCWVALKNYMAAQP